MRPIRVRHNLVAKQNGLIVLRLKCRIAIEELQLIGLEVSIGYPVRS